MQDNLRIYLSGSIKKGRLDQRAESEFWTRREEQIIRQQVKVRSVLLNPAKSSIRRNDYFGNYGCDLYLVQSADVVLADLRTEKGLGVGAELMYAQFIGKTVIGWVPNNSYYRREKLEDVFGEDLLNWTHPFVFGLCDVIVDELLQACDHINRMNVQCGFKKDASKSPKVAIDAFKRSYGYKS